MINTDILHPEFCRLLPKIRQYSHIKIIVVIKENQEISIGDMTDYGIFDFIEHNASMNRMQFIIKKALYTQMLESENATLHADMDRRTQDITELHRMIGSLEKNSDRIRQEVEQRIFVQIHSLFLPFIEDIMRYDHDKLYEARLQALQKYLNDLSSSLASHLQDRAALSSQELRIALMIRNGRSSSQIAVQLQVSPETVKTHRRNIRRKLGLTSTPQKLSAYLQSLQPLDKPSDHRLSSETS